MGHHPPRHRHRAHRRGPRRTGGQELGPRGRRGDGRRQPDHPVHVRAVLSRLGDPGDGPGPADPVRPDQVAHRGRPLTPRFT
ncbi:hypothetical protein SGPA1_50298 [Streptomyces misionensis JCM 4497]